MRISVFTWWMVSPGIEEHVTDLGILTTSFIYLNRGRQVNSDLTLHKLCTILDLVALQDVGFQTIYSTSNFMQYLNIGWVYFDVCD